MKEILLSELNDRIRSSPECLIIDAEAAYDKQLRDLADDICRRALDMPIVLISGPSGSGKTTTACRIEQILDAAGYESHTISMDNYFADNARNPHLVDQDGNPDYESPLRLDIDLLNTQLEQLARGETVELPVFDFKTQTQQRSGRFLTRQPNELIIMEGIHALNPEVTGIQAATRIYLSVRTRIKDGDVRLHPSLIRFSRRLLRDSRTRGRGAEETLRMLKSISRGENLYIMPYKHLADFELDTFMSYELPVYRAELLETVRALAEQAAPETGIRTLYEFLAKMEPMDTEWIPHNSLVREFIGGSVFTD